MPCSILSEVTATVIGYAINSLSFLNFDFLGSFLIPGLGLTDDTMFRILLVHFLAPVVMFLFIIEHLNSLHFAEYTDDDEMDIAFFARFEYLEDFFVVEVYC
jgi:cytochrome b561